MSVFILLRVYPVQSQLVSIDKTGLEFIKVWESVDLESGWVVVVCLSSIFVCNQQCRLVYSFTSDIKGCIIVEKPIVVSAKELV